MFSSRAPRRRGLRASGPTPSERRPRRQRGAMWGASPGVAVRGRPRPVAARRGRPQVKRRLRRGPRRSAYQRLVAAARGGAKHQFRRGRLRAPWRAPRAWPRLVWRRRGIELARRCRSGVSCGGGGVQARPSPSDASSCRCVSPDMNCPCAPSRGCKLSSASRRRKICAGVLPKNYKILSGAVITVITLTRRVVRRNPRYPRAVGYLLSYRAQSVQLRDQADQACIPSLHRRSRNNDAPRGTPSEGSKQGVSALCELAS